MKFEFETMLENITEQEHELLQIRRNTPIAFIEQKLVQIRRNRQQFYNDIEQQYKEDHSIDIYYKETIETIHYINLLQNIMHFFRKYDLKLNILVDEYFRENQRVIKLLDNAPDYSQLKKSNDVDNLKISVASDELKLIYTVRRYNKAVKSSKLNKARSFAINIIKTEQEKSVNKEM